MSERIKRCLLLFSGGIDSTACLFYYLSKKYTVSPVFINFGQASKNKELESVSHLSDYFDVETQTVDFSHSMCFNSGEICGRNAFLIFSTLMAYSQFNGIIAMGLHRGTQYYDCSTHFVNDIQKMLYGYRNGQIIFEAPFLTWSKQMIFQYSLDNDIPIELTYSCEKGGEEPCGICMSCLDRRSLLC